MIQSWTLVVAVEIYKTPEEVTASAGLYVGVVTVTSTNPENFIGAAPLENVPDTPLTVPVEFTSPLKVEVPAKDGVVVDAFVFNCV